ncbi:MAG: hypothetical protein BGO43_00095 [Gammaproteobacteria bacterium 39-13]|nr:GNAT family N-acetyltransferase [Gammaproteobacteria bacterium]OJV96667.1 MAG: hypothetical protein BGO43_00095 [Gammaproteobacteria bacterium 39-13]
MTFTIVPLRLEDGVSLSHLFKLIGWEKPLSLFQAYLQEQQEGKRNAYVAKLDNITVGYITIQWQSEYLYFQKRGIPEIKDLNVLPAYHLQGFGKALLSYAEEKVRQRTTLVGIGVGLTKDYGAAQILYVKQGYIPNGEGITHHYQMLRYGDNVKIDDDTVLWLTKDL